MTKKLKHFLRGMGSVMDLSPPPRGDRFASRGTDAERLRADFVRIGKDMQRVFERETRDAEAHPAPKAPVVVVKKRRSRSMADGPGA